MKAVVLSAFEKTPELVELDKPSPGDGEVRVRVAAASINGFDLAVAGGYVKDMMEHRFPVVLGKDFSGTIDAVGAGVADYEIGDRVFGVVTKPFLGDGSFAEYVTVPVAVGIAKLPDGITFVDGAALGLAGSAAVDAIDAARLTAGALVLIAGATGGVGNQAVQLAVRAGARVIATAHSDAEVAQVTALGARETVDYTDDIAAQLRQRHPDGADVVLHFAGDPAALVAAVASGGSFVSTLAQSAAQIGAADDVRFVPIMAAPSTATLDRLAASQAANHTSVGVQRVYPLEKTTDAFADFAAGTLGKLVVAID